MHRDPLLTMLRDYRSRHPDEVSTVDRVERLVRSHEDCLLRTCRVGHITASCWIASPDHDRALLTHHKKLGRWLQLGGHVDGEPRVHLAALREAQEESGMQHFSFWPETDGDPLPIDVDVHPIPPHRGEPRHEHHDIRFLLIAAPDQQIVVSDESHDLRWLSDREVRELAGDESVQRLHRKARLALSRR